MEFGQAIVTYLADLSLRPLCLAAGAWAAVHLFRIRSAAGRHAVWTLMTAAMLLTAALRPALPSLPLRVLKPVTAKPIAATPTVTTAPVSAASQAPAPNRPRIAWREAAAASYVSGLLWFAGLLASSYHFTRKLVRSSRRIDGIGADEVLESAWIAVPMTVGLLRPKILLPAGWREWTAEKLEAVMAHERTHVRRSDWAVAVLAGLNRCLFWFHPLAWWLERQSAALAEQACDDEALLALGRRECYAQTLLDMTAAVQSGRGRMVWEAMAMARTAEVRQRIERILDETRELPRGWTRARWLAVAVCCAPLVYITAAVRVAPAQEVRLAPDTVLQLEQTLRTNPEDLDARCRLIASYYLSGLRQPRLDHIFWLIAHHPESDQTLFQSKGILPRTTTMNDAADFGRAAELWTQQAGLHPKDVPVLTNAAEFLSQPGGDPAKAAGLRRQIAALSAPSPLKPNSASPGRATTAPPPYPFLIDVPGTDMERRLAKTVEPVYPPDAIRAGIQGDVILKTVVGEDGHVKNARPISGNPLLAAAAQEAVQQYVYRPRVVNNEAGAEIGSTATVVFRLPGAEKTSVAALGSSGGIISPAVLIYKKDPEYPKMAQQVGVTGTVEMLVTIGADGHVRGAKVITGPSMLQRAAQDAVMQWVYKPTLLNGVPVENETRVTMTFGGVGASSAPAPAPWRGTISPAQLVFKRDPDYPKVAQQMGVKGVVELIATIGVDGHVKEVRVIKGPEMLLQPAVDAVRQWVYKPTMANGVPVENETHISISFSGDR